MRALYWRAACATTDFPSENCSPSSAACIFAENSLTRRPLRRLPLERDAQELFRQAGKRCEVVLLGSIATAKYVEPLLAIFGERLFFPSAFVGRGDMSRGGLMLRAVREAAELSYEPVSSAVLHGPRPPKLSKL